MPDVASWLADLGLEKYAESFAKNEIDLSTLPHLSEEDLRELGLPIGPRRKVLAAIGRLRADAQEMEPVDLPLPGAQPAGEWRQVTVLFADLIGYSRMSSELDAEELHGLLERFFGVVDQIVEEHGGRVDKHIGDCVMAIFGAPVAHGNDAERAVRAAIVIRDAMSSLSVETAHDVQVHIGVADGQVVASETGSTTHHEYTVTGESVNLAARLTDAASTNEILISDSVQRILADQTEASDAGLLSVKGFAEPIRAWRLSGLHARSRRRSLIGRRVELEQFGAVLGACLETQRGRAVYVRGEAGIGKTCLLEEFLAVARQKGFACHAAFVLDFGSGIGRDAIRVLVRDILGLGPASPLDDVLAEASAAMKTGLVAPEDEVFLNDLLGLPQPPELRVMYDAMDNSVRNAGKCQTMIRLVERTSRARPRAIAVEDLHWADPLTLAHLARLAAAVTNCPVVLVMTSRLDHDQLDLVWRTEVHGSPLLSLDLGPLHDEEATALAASIFTSDAAVARRCIERAGGNPLFLEQLLRHAAEGEDSNVPGTVQSLVQARLDRLDPTDKSALQTASVLGQRFDPVALAHLLEQPGYSPERLVAHFMIRPQGEEFLFAHALIHEAIYGSLLKRRRGELHRRAAKWFAERDPVLRAAHLDRAADPEAAQAYLAAARSQAAEYRYESARRLVERGLELALDRSDRFLLGCFHGDILHDLGSMPESLNAYAGALEAADDDAERCQAWIGCAAVKRVTDDLDGAFADLDRAEAIAVTEGLKVEESRLRFLRGNLCFPRGDIEGCLGEHERSLELAREAGAPDLEAAALGGLGDAEYVRSRMISAHDRLTECVALARRQGLGRIEVANLAQIAHTMLYFRPQREALDQALAAASGAARVGHLRAELNSRVAALKALHVLGEWDACRRGVGRAQDLVRQLSAWRFEQNCLLALGQIAHAEGDREEAVSVLRQAEDTASRTGIGFHGPIIYGALALALDDTDESRAALVRGERLIGEGCVGHNQLWFYPQAMDACLKMSDFEEVERYALLLEGYTRPEPLPWSDFFIARGRMLASIGRGTSDHSLVDDLRRLRETGKRLGYEVALPALDNALADSTAS